MRRADADATTRQRIADHLREQPAAASTLASEFAITTATALDHVEHIAQWTCQLIRTHLSEFLLADPFYLVLSVKPCRPNPILSQLKSLCPTQNELISKLSFAKRRLRNVMRSVLGSFC